MQILSFFKKNKPGKDHPPEVRRYLERSKSPLLKKTPLRHLRFAVLDTETTGLDVTKDRILSLAVVGVHDFGIHVEDRLEIFIRQTQYAPGESVTVHGITAARSRNGIPEREAMLNLLSFLQDRILVGHHIRFDQSMLNAALQRHFNIHLKNQTLDTAALESRLTSPVGYRQIPQSPASLDALCRKYGIEMDDRHTAAGDTIITALLFLKLLARLETKGVKTAGDLLRR